MTALGNKYPRIDMLSINQSINGREEPTYQRGESQLKMQKKIYSIPAFL